MGQENYYHYYVEPLNDFANNIISQIAPEEEALREVLCSDGRKRNLWRLDMAQFSKIIRSVWGKEEYFNYFAQKNEGGIERIDFIDLREKIVKYCAKNLDNLMKICGVGKLKSSKLKAAAEEFLGKPPTLLKSNSRRRSKK